MIDTVGAGKGSVPRKVDGPSYRDNHDFINWPSKKKKVIIAGGRDYQFTPRDIEFLDSLESKIAEVVSGDAAGADSEGEGWAEMRGIPVKLFPADWKKHGRAAGPLRNKQMAEYADAVVLFPGGRGTQSMYNEAAKRGLTIYDKRN